jgi:hypothetical protein
MHTEMLISNTNILLMLQRRISQNKNIYCNHTVCKIIAKKC